jgi:hypothetical protein
MNWHRKSPWNHVANESYEKYKPMISTLQDEKMSSHKPAIKIAKLEALKQDPSLYKQLMHSIDLNPNYIITRESGDLIRRTKAFKTVVLKR